MAFLFVSARKIRQDKVASSCENKVFDAVKIFFFPLLLACDASLTLVQVSKTIGIKLIEPEIISGN